MIKQIFLVLSIFNTVSAMHKSLTPLEETFLNAASMGDTRMVEECIGKKVNINVLDGNGEPALFLAAYYNRWSILTLLLQQPNIIVDTVSPILDKKLSVLHCLCSTVTDESQAIRAHIIKTIVEKKRSKKAKREMLGILDGYCTTPLFRLFLSKPPASLIEYIVDAGAPMTWGGRLTKESPLTVASQKSAAYTLAILKSPDLQLCDIQQAGRFCHEARFDKLHLNEQLALISRYFVKMRILGFVQPMATNWGRSEYSTSAPMPLAVAQLIAYAAAKYQ